MDFPNVLRPLVLASASPRRRDILARLGLAFEVRPAEIDEPDLPAGGEVPPAERIARMKARHVARSAPGGTVVGADTTVGVGTVLVGKPESAEDAHRILSFLSGKIQDVISGVCLVHVPSGIELSGHAVTRVYTRPMSLQEIGEYVATGECFGKAGAYAIQETGDRFIERIDGSFDNVVGFPTEVFVALVADLAARVAASQEARRG